MMKCGGMNEAKIRGGEKIGLNENIYTRVDKIQNLIFDMGMIMWKLLLRDLFL